MDPSKKAKGLTGSPHLVPSASPAIQGTGDLEGSDDGRKRRQLSMAVGAATTPATLTATALVSNYAHQPPPSPLPFLSLLTSSTGSAAAVATAAPSPLLLPSGGRTGSPSLFTTRGSAVGAVALTQYNPTAPSIVRGASPHTLTAGMSAATATPTFKSTEATSAAPGHISQLHHHGSPPLGDYSQFMQEAASHRCVLRCKCAVSIQRD
jgi:hypothetical protein